VRPPAAGRRLPLQVSIMLFKFEDLPIFSKAQFQKNLRSVLFG
jgi:hypothetical protein